MNSGLSQTNEEYFFNKIKELERTIQEMKADQIAANSIIAEKIANNAITTDKIAALAITNAKINDLSADKITAGTLTGRTVQTSASGQRVALEGSNSRFAGYDSAGGLRVFLGVDQNNFDQISLVFLDENGNYAGGITGTYYAPWETPVLALNAFLSVNNDMEVGGVLTVDSDLEVLGSKDFNIPHPTKEGKRLIYAAIESPEVLVMSRGKAEEEPPQHFFDVSEPDTINVITGIDGNWIATAVRKGYLNRDPEPDDTKGLNPQHPDDQKEALTAYARQSMKKAEALKKKPKKSEEEIIEQDQS